MLGKWPHYHHIARHIKELVGGRKMPIGNIADTNGEWEKNLVQVQIYLTDDLTHCLVNMSLSIKLKSNALKVIQF